jgi:hypothetical protein
MADVSSTEQGSFLIPNGSLSLSGLGQGPNSGHNTSRGPLLARQRRTLPDRAELGPSALFSRRSDRSGAQGRRIGRPLANDHDCSAKRQHLWENCRNAWQFPRPLYHHLSRLNYWMICQRWQRFARTMGRENEPRSRFDLMVIPKFNYRYVSDRSWASKQVCQV